MTTEVVRELRNSLSGTGPNNPYWATYRSCLVGFISGSGDERHIAAQKLVSLVILAPHLAELHNRLAASYANLGSHFLPGVEVSADYISVIFSGSAVHRPDCTQLDAPTNGRYILDFATAGLGDKAANELMEGATEALEEMSLDPSSEFPDMADLIHQIEDINNRPA